MWILLDDFKRQVIEGRPHLIDHLPGKYGDRPWWGLWNVDLHFALRLDGDIVRLAGGVALTHRLIARRCFAAQMSLSSADLMLLTIDVKSAVREPVCK